MLWLASASPRRRRMLEMMQVEFSTCAAGEEPEDANGMKPESFALRAARHKASVVSGRYPDDWVLAADTVVDLDGSLLGKPKDRADAESMLRRLSGRTHRVVTAVQLLAPGSERFAHLVSVSHVTFHRLDDRWVRWYAGTEEPLDKAGAYGIQGRGGALVKSVRGSYTNVVGLPLGETLAMLERAGLWRPAVAGGER